MTQSMSYITPRISELYFNISNRTLNSTQFFSDHFDDGLSHFDFYTTNFTLTTITLIGHGFGSDDYTPRFSLGQSTVEASDWISDSSMACKFSEQSISATRLSAVTSGSQVLKTCSTIRLKMPTLILMELILCRLRHFPNLFRLNALWSN